MVFAAYLSASPSGGYAVPAPRPTDAIGAALRAAYRDTTMPADLVVLVEKLHRA